MKYKIEFEIDVKSKSDRLKLFGECAIYAFRQVVDNCPRRVTKTFFTDKTCKKHLAMCKVSKEK